MKTKPAILEAVLFISKMSSQAVEWRQVPRILTNAGFPRREGVLNVALKELEAEGKILILRRGRSRADWDVELPKDK